MLHGIKWDYVIFIDFAITRLNTLPSGHIIKYSMAIVRDLLPRERLTWKTLLPDGVQYDPSPAWKNIPNKFETQPPSMWKMEEETSYISERDEREADTSSSAEWCGKRDRKKRGQKERRRESFYVLALLIGLHSNFKQVWNSDPGRRAHYDADRRIKRREGNVANFCDPWNVSLSRDLTIECIKIAAPFTLNKRSLKSHILFQDKRFLIFLKYIEKIFFNILMRHVYKVIIKD